MEMIKKAVTPAMLELFKKLGPVEGEPMVAKCEPVDDRTKIIAEREKALRVLLGAGRE